MAHPPHLAHLDTYKKILQEGSINLRTAAANDPITNCRLNFRDPPSFYTRLNPGVKIEYERVPAFGIIEDLSSVFRDSEKVLDDPELNNLLRLEYETWDLLRCMNLADKVYFSNNRYVFILTRF